MSLGSKTEHECAVKQEEKEKGEGEREEEQEWEWVWEQEQEIKTDLKGQVWVLNCNFIVHDRWYKGWRSVVGKM